MEHKNRTKELTETALFVAVIIVMSAVPFLGYIPLGPINATTLHLPVIIGAILFGWKRGALLGGVFGLTSLVKNTISPNASSFVFSPFVPVLGSEKGSLWALAVVLLPRILIGVFAALVFSALVKAKMARPIACAVAGFVGSMTNTIFVMGGIYLFFGHSYAAVKDIAYETLLTTIRTIVTGSGLVEAAVAAVLSAAIGTALLRSAAFRRE